MDDWIGFGFLLLLFGAALFGLRLLARPVVSTEQEFEKRASRGASLLTAGIEGINGFLNPSAEKGKKAVQEVKEGRYARKKREGKGLGSPQEEKK